MGTFLAVGCPRTHEPYHDAHLLVREITSINLCVSRYHFFADFQRETSEKTGLYDPAFTIFLSECTVRRWEDGATL